jgi:hypothetical protein
MIFFTVLAIIAFVFFSIISFMMIEMHRSYKKKEPVYTALAIMWLLVIAIFAIAYFNNRDNNGIEPAKASENTNEINPVPIASPNL